MMKITYMWIARIINLNIFFSVGRQLLNMLKIKI